MRNQFVRALRMRQLQYRAIHQTSKRHKAASIALSSDSKHAPFPRHLVRPVGVYTFAQFINSVGFGWYFNAMIYLCNVKNTQNNTNFYPLIFRLCYPSSANIFWYFYD